VGVPDIGGETAGIKSKMGANAGPEFTLKLGGNDKHFFDNVEFTAGLQASATANLEGKRLGFELGVDLGLKGSFKFDHADPSGSDRLHLTIGPEFTGGVTTAGNIGQLKGKWSPHFNVGQEQLGADAFFGDVKARDNSPQECAPEASPAVEQHDKMSEPVQ
jgi:hypothetical protein